MATLKGNRNIPALKIKTPQIEARLVRDEQMKVLYLPLTSAVVLKGKKEMLYVPLDFKNGLWNDAPVDSGA